MSETQAEDHLQPKKPTTPIEPKESTTPPKAPRKKRRTKKKEKDVIPNMELALIAMFFLSFIIWTVSKCTVTQAKYEEEATSTAATNTVKKDSISAANTQAIKAAAKKAKTPPAKITKTVVKEVTKLYVVLDQLKLRNGPTRDSSIVYQFKLNDRVTFLEQVTDFKEKINLGNRIADEPWIKVRGKGGHEGWVYGAGVHYYPQAIPEPPSPKEE